MRSVTFPLGNCIACPTALLLRVHHGACALTGLISDPVSWHHCDIFFQLLLDSGDCCVGVTGCFVDLSSTSVCTWLSPLLFRSVWRL